MYIIAHTECVVYSRMVLSMFPLLFTVEALRWAQYDLASDGDFLECPFLFLSSSTLCHAVGTAETEGREMKRRYLHLCHGGDYGDDSDDHDADDDAAGDDENDTHADHGPHDDDDADDVYHDDDAHAHGCSNDDYDVNGANYDDDSDDGSHV